MFNRHNQELLDVSRGVPCVIMTVSGKNFFEPRNINGFLAIFTPNVSAAALTHLCIYLDPGENFPAFLQAIQDTWAPLEAALTSVPWYPRFKVADASSVAGEDLEELYQAGGLSDASIRR